AGALVKGPIPCVQGLRQRPEVLNGGPVVKASADAIRLTGGALMGLVVRDLDDAVRLDTRRGGRFYWHRILLYRGVCHGPGCCKQRRPILLVQLEPLYVVLLDTSSGARYNYSSRCMLSLAPSQRDLPCRDENQANGRWQWGSGYASCAKP